VPSSLINVGSTTTIEPRTIAVPGWPSDRHSVTVQFKDYLDRAFPAGLR
jgi:hypothetical protein